MHENGKNISQIDLQQFSGGHIFCVIGDYIGLEQEDELCLKNFAKQNSIPWIDVSLGSMSLLSSHCIVILNHYLDLV